MTCFDLCKWMINLPIKTYIFLKYQIESDLDDFSNLPMIRSKK